MGAESFLLASTMNAIVGQRIVRKICNNCKKDYTPAKLLISDLKNTLGPLLTIQEDKIRLYQGSGCEMCGHTGYLGRMGIFEVLPVSEAIGKLIISNETGRLP
jgi:type II secretory ATPase GspE/PulE/Tfp pilus assembly ATPase PilB-like protein